MLDTCGRCGNPKNGYKSSYCQPCWSDMQYRRRHGIPLERPPEQACSRCGAMFRPVRHLRDKYCSVECRYSRNLDTSRSKHKAARLAAIGDRNCLHCGGPIRSAARIEAKFCSPQCNSRAHALKRKLRANGYLRIQIAERDAWKCGICKKRIDPAARHPDPGFGSIDHIVPRSRGGSHDPRNLRIVHLVCNLSRRDDFDAEELSLSPRALDDLRQTLFDD